MKIHHATRAKAAKFNIALTIEDNEVVATSKAGVRLASGLQGNKVLEDAITKQTGKPAKGTGAVRTASSHNIKLSEIDPTLPAKVKAAKAAKPVVETDPYEAAAKEDGWKKTRWGFSKEDEESIRADSWQALCEEAGIEVEAEEGDDDDSDADQSKSIVKAKYKTLYKPHKDRSGDELSHKINEHVSREDEETGEMRISKDALRKFAQANGCWVASYGSLVSRTGSWNAGMARMNVANRLRAKIRQAKKTGEEFKIDWA